MRDHMGEMDAAIDLSNSNEQRRTVIFEKLTVVPFSIFKDEADRTQLGVILLAKIMHSYEMEDALDHIEATIKTFEEKDKEG